MELEKERNELGQFLFMEDGRSFDMECCSGQHLNQFRVNGLLSNSEIKMVCKKIASHPKLDGVE
jgi:hypothetical protein